jgi:hypothetical protein
METKRVELEAAQQALSDAEMALYSAKGSDDVRGDSAVWGAYLDAHRAMDTANQAIDRALAALPPEHDRD